MSQEKVKIYTKTGDKGKTSLFGGKRVDKNDPRIKVVGAIDELNAALGLAHTSSKVKNSKVVINSIQNELFNIGAYIADPDKLSQKTKRLSGFNPKKIAELEKLVDDIDTKLPELKNFILPSGSETGTRLHFARSVCRRVERELVELSRRNENIDPNIQVYLNRLSDLLFVLARSENKKTGKKELYWKKA